MKPASLFLLGLGMGLVVMAWLSQRQTAPLHAEIAELRALKEREVARRTIFAKQRAEIQRNLDAAPADQKLRVAMKNALRPRPISPDDEKGDDDAEQLAHG